MKRNLLRQIISLMLTLFLFTLNSYAYNIIDTLSQFDSSSVEIPLSHPRVLFTSDDIPRIYDNINNNNNMTSLSNFSSMLTKTTVNVLDETNEDNADNATLAAIRAKAFAYAVLGKYGAYQTRYNKYGHDAILSIIDYLAKYNYPEQDFETLVSYHQVTYTIFMAACVYDWCYDAASEEERGAIENYLLEMADYENSFLSLKSLYGFGSSGASNFIQRDFLALGIAIYDKYPQIFNYVSEKLVNDFSEIQNYFNAAQAPFVGLQYGQSEMFACAMAFRLLKPFGINLYTKDLFDASWFYVYSQLPDGTTLVDGDDYLFAKNTPNTTYIVYDLMMLAACGAHYFNDENLALLFKEKSNGYTVMSNGIIGFQSVDYFLLNDYFPDQTSELDLSDSKYFGSPLGMIISRTGWNNSSAVVRMKISEAFKNHHQHYDAGSFEIYYKGRLTGQSAQYSRTDTDQYSNYYIQSIASNTLLIKDPEEVFTYWNSNAPAENSGGQRIQRNTSANLSEWKNANHYNGSVEGYEIAADNSYSYLSGDITKAYSDKVSEVKRSMLFIPKNENEKAGIMFVIDKINATSADYEKKFVLHTPSEPVISGNSAVISRTDNSYNGRLTLKTVYPENHSITAIGGEASQWLVNGTNYQPDINYADKYVPELANDPLAYGWGRLEVSPAYSNNLDFFVNVLYIDDANADEAPDAIGIENNIIIGAQTDNEAIVYAKSSARTTDDINFDIDENCNVKVCNIKEGIWRLYNNKNLIKTIEVSEQSGMAAFSAGKGNIKLTYSGINAEYEDGSAEHPFSINSVSEFKALADFSTNGKYYKIKNDLDLTDDYTPIELNGGYFDFENHSVDLNLSNSHRLGLFKTIAGKTQIKNLIINGKMNGWGYIGAVSGEIISNADIEFENIINNAEITASNYAGGIIGSAANAKNLLFKNVINNGNVTSSNWYCGGLVGGVTASETAVFENCLNKGMIYSKNTSSSANAVGGLVGLGKAVFNKCYNSGDIKSDNITNGGAQFGIGGILGVSRTSGTSIIDCFNSGKISAEGTPGGLIGTVGFNGSNPSIKNSYTTVLTPVGYILTNGGFGGQNIYYFADSETDNNDKTTALTEELRYELDSYSGFSSDIWQINSDTGYNYPNLTETLYTVENGNAENPYLIKTYNDFIAMSNNLGDAKYYKLFNDITLPDDYIPFGFNGGVLDGNNKKITVNINQSEYAGLFSSVSGNSEIHNLIIEGSITGDTYIGSVTGIITSPGKVYIHDCINNANISASGNRVGGFIGDLYTGSGITSSNVILNNLINNGDISGNYWVGGIAGLSKIYISGMINNGNISGNNAGGIIGLTYSGIAKSYNNGEVTSDLGGGISGYVIGGNIISSYNTGSIKKKTSGMVGGITAQLQGNAYVSGCYNTYAGLDNFDEIVCDSTKSTAQYPVRNCFYISKDGTNAKNGSLAVTSLELRDCAETLGVDFEKSTNIYRYPQIKGLALNEKVITIPEPDKAYLYSGNLNYSDLVSLSDNFWSLRDKPASLLYIIDEGENECGIAYSQDEINYLLIPVSEVSNRGKYLFYLTGTNQSIYIKPYAKDEKGDIYYGKTVKMEFVIPVK